MAPRIPQVNQSGPRPTGYAGWAASQPAPRPAGPVNTGPALAQYGPALLQAAQTQTDAQNLAKWNAAVKAQTDAQNLAKWNAAVAAQQPQQQPQQAAPQQQSSSVLPAPAVGLSASDQHQYDLATDAYMTARANDQARLTQAGPMELAAEAKSNYAAAVSRANSDAMMAARNMMGSGISASSLADINLTLNNNLMTLRTNLGTLTSTLNGHIATLDANHRTDQAYYGGLAAQQTLTGDNTGSSLPTDGGSGAPSPAAAATAPPPAPAPAAPAAAATKPPPTGYAGWAATPAGQKSQPFPTVSTKQYTPPPLPKVAWHGAPPPGISKGW